MSLVSHSENFQLSFLKGLLVSFKYPKNIILFLYDFPYFNVLTNLKTKFKCLVACNIWKRVCTFSPVQPFFQIHWRVSKVSQFRQKVNVFANLPKLVTNCFKKGIDQSHKHKNTLFPLSIKIQVNLGLKPQWRSPFAKAVFYKNKF